MRQPTASDRRLFGYILLFITLLLPGCGRKTLPVPPQNLVPVAISDLGFSLAETGVTLSWSPPTHDVRGKELVELDGYEILRAEVPKTRYCPDCPVVFNRIANLPGSPVNQEQPAKITFHDPTISPGNYYLYKIRCRSGWYLSSDDSNKVTFLWTKLLAAPTDLRITTYDSMLNLLWRPPAFLATDKSRDAELIYQVMRSENGNDFQAIANNVRQTSFVDTGLKNGRQYWYKVRARLSSADVKGFGAASNISAATPADRTAPPVPTGFNGMLSASGTKLWWDHAADPDLAGYRIYRRQAGQAASATIDTVKDISRYHDHQLPSGAAIWYYSIAAFDHAEPANESERTQEITINTNP